MLLRIQHDYGLRLLCMIYTNALFTAFKKIEQLCLNKKETT